MAMQFYDINSKLLKGQSESQYLLLKKGKSTFTLL